MKKTEIIRFTANAQEKEVLRQAAADIGISMSAFIKEAIYWQLQEKRAADTAIERKGRQEVMG